ncbi:MAG: flippase-like domain-containing protein [Proteobacteria bacterium]|nr:flippase-like domain-containing protein [Pseudomonadota bacterium]MBU1057804.1 flippase-like domain-containing protein [Pseudomonadota bacterium]
MDQSFRYFKKIFAHFFVIGLLIWLIFYSNLHFSHVYDYFFMVNWVHLLICISIFYLHILLVCYAWFYVLRGLGLDLPFWQAGVVLGASTIAKYLPGGIWQIGSRTVGLTTYQGKPIQVALSIFIEQIISLSACLILAVLFLQRGSYLSWNNFFSTIPRFVSLFLAMVLFFCFCSPYTYRLFLKFIPWLGSRLNFHNLNFRYLIKINFLHYISLLIFSLGYWIGIKAYIPAFSIHFFEFTALIMIATFSGLIAIFTPAGLGVREAILFAGIQGDVGQDMALTLAIIPRFLIIISEVTFYFSMLLVKWYSNKNK